MKEKFENWYESTWGSKSEDTDESNKAFYAWQACKLEVLTILNSPLNQDYSGDTIKLKVIHEIEKL